MIAYEQEAIALVKKAIVSEGLDEKLLEFPLDDWLERPKNPEHGDIAFPCFRLAQPAGMAPQKLSATLAAAIDLNGSNFASVVAAGPFLNFSLGQGAAVQFLTAVLKQQEYFAHTTEGNGQKILIEYSSPNVAKEFHIGHFRNTVLGQSLCNLYRAFGYDVVAINHLGDWGSQFGKVAYAYIHWGDEAELKKAPLEYLTKLYVRFHEEAEQNPELDREARLLFKKIEEKDPKLTKIWQDFVAISIEALEATYERLGAKFDHYLGESFYIDKVDGVLAALRAKNLLEESEGAQVVMLDSYKMPPCIILTGDGTTLYHTRDLAAALYRKKHFQFDRCLYVVGSEQALHFQQLFKVLELMGEDWYSSLEHVKYGLYRFKDGKFSTRKGKSILMAEVIAEAKKKVTSIIAEKNPDLVNADDVAEIVALGAIIYNDLSTDRVKEVEFSWDKVLDFEGDTGPYLLYTYARSSSILRKAKEAKVVPTTDIAKLARNEALCEYTMRLLKLFGQFNGAIRGAIRLNKPSIVANYCLELARTFNSYYRNVKVLDDNESAETIKFRLEVVRATRIVLKSGLALLCMRAPEQM